VGCHSGPLFGELRLMVRTDPALEGALKTPGLRGVAGGPPYMHAGQFSTLEQVVRHCVAAPHAAVGHSELTHRHAGAGSPTHAERAERLPGRRPGELSRHMERAALVRPQDTAGYARTTSHEKQPRFAL
jgi:hypothetical protein